MGFNPAQPRGTGGQWTSGGGGPAGKGGKDLRQAAKAAGISESRLLALNPGLKKLAGTGRVIPRGTVVAGKASAAKAAAKSQAGHKAGVASQVAKGRTKAAASAAAKKTAATKPASKPPTVVKGK